MKRKREAIIGDLPLETLSRVFSFLGGVSLVRASTTCRTWRGVIADDAFPLWHGVCRRLWLLDMSGFPQGRSPSSVAITFWSGSRGLMSSCAATRTKARGQLVPAYREHYFHYREKICVHCLLIYPYPLAYKLFDGVRLCRRCRTLEPFAHISRSNARRIFRLGAAVRERDEKPLACVRYDSGRRDGKRICVMYRAGEVLELAAYRQGKSMREVVEEAGRRGYKLSTMTGEHIKDV